MVLYTFVKTKIYFMKKLFLYSLLLLSTQVVAQNFDDLVSRTINGKLTPYDFDNSNEYTLNIGNSSNPNPSNYFYFKNNIGITNESNRVLKLFKDGKIIETHQYMGVVPSTIVTRLRVGKEIYLIEWWFKNDNNKISGISILNT
jgi:hypothetical protein